MTQTELDYRSVIRRIALALIFFEGLYFVFSAIVVFLPAFTDPLQPALGDVAYELIYAFLYAAVFILPVFFFRKIPADRAPEPMYRAKKLPRYAPFYLLAGVAIISAASYANSYLFSFFDVVSGVTHTHAAEGATANYQFVLMVLSSVIVPAFVEEFFFRGLILSNLLPFGRGTAILLSALLFGVMHQSFEQLFYATVAGVVLGFLYVKTRSIWPCVLLHFLNNFISVFQSVLVERLSDTAGIIAGVIQGGVFSLGVISAIALLILDRNMLDFDTVSGDITPNESENEGILPLRRVRLFFSAPMIAYLLIALGSAVAFMLF